MIPFRFLQTSELCFLPCKDTVTSVVDGHRFVYSVIDGDETLIDLDRHSGVILLARTIADEDIRMHQKHLNISVSDGVFTAYSQLIIEIVASTSRRALPRFEQAQYSASVSENGKIGAPIIRIRAREGIPPLKYSFGGNNDLRTWPVAIDKESGKVTSRWVD
ncbi:unnamed protein product [Anisakis simplex]|uniref:Cadherin domain-containing protein n=1 Tax=Anisakis simplex TaxID=6269 RepID=A0A0M3JBU4_ANISI|nr:unnamed protein product [Anisakis simplex]